MSVNSSNTPNCTFLPSTLPLSNSTILPFNLQCLQHLASVVLYSLYAFTNILLLLPLYIFVLYIGYRRWKQQTTSHSDILTYHIVAVEVVGVLGSFLFTLGMYINSLTLNRLGILIPSVIFPGQTLFHCLTCLDRYVAVVHPIIYMRLRERGGVRIRNVSIACVWLLCFGWIGLTKSSTYEVPMVPLISLFVIALIFITICSLSVLFVLTHPGPGFEGGDKEGVAQSKKRAFCIILLITAVLLLRFVGILATFGLYSLKSIHVEVKCALMDFGMWLTVPSSLVLPLLFLHKLGQLGCCRRRAVPC